MLEAKRREEQLQAEALDRQAAYRDPADEARRLDHVMASQPDLFGDLDGAALDDVQDAWHEPPREPMELSDSVIDMPELGDPKEVQGGIDEG